MKHIRFLAPFLLLVGLAGQQVNAGLILDLNTGGSSQSCGSCGNTNGDTFGWSFTVLNPIAIDGLGVWDAGADGLGVASTPVGLWTSGGTLLASGTVTNTSTSVASTSTSGEWLFEDIAPLILGTGDYVIGSVFLSASPTAQTGAPFTNVADISVTGGVMGPFDGGLAFPGSTFDFPIFGPTIRQVSIPEPGSIALLGLGLAAFAISRRRKQ